MEQAQIEKLRLWFAEYVGGFYGEDEFINANIKLKEEHSRRTCEEMVELAEELGLTENQKRMAEAIALLHDIGRFRQFVRYRTYNDPRSVNHCLLGLEVLRERGVLEGIERRERELIERAIEYHGLMELPDDLEGECLLFSRMIRDADKVDIFYVVTKYYKQYRDEPEEFKLELELPDEPWYSAGVVEDVLEGRRIDYNGLRTLNDMKLCQLAWVYDVNFSAALRRIMDRGLLEKIFAFLPTGEDIDKVRVKIFEYVEWRIEQGKDEK